jgi:ribonuclease J
MAEQVGIPKENILVVENGQVIEFSENGGGIGEKILTGRVLIDGKGVGDVGRSVLKERRNLSEDGIVVVNMVFDEETGIVVYGPEIVSHGFVFETETGHLLEDAKCIILEIVDEVGPVVPDRINKIRSKMQTDLRKFFSFTIRRRPVILLSILEV